MMNNPEQKNRLQSARPSRFFDISDKGGPL